MATKLQPIRIVCPECRTVSGGSCYSEFKSFQLFGKHMFYEHEWTVHNAFIFMRKQNPERYKGNGPI